MKTSKYLTRALTLTALLATPASWATDYYVHAERGSNQYDGKRPEAAFATISYAVRQLSAGDTLYVRFGEYKSFPNMTAARLRSGTKDKPIRIMPYEREKPIFSLETPIRFQGGIKWWQIEGLRFRSSREIRIGEIDGSSCVSFANHISIHNNIFEHSTPTSGQVVINCAEDVRITDNTFTNIRSRRVGVDTHAVMTAGIANNVKISGNTFTDIGADGVQLQGRVRDVDISFNEFEVQHPYRYRDETGRVVSTGNQRFKSVGENAIDIKAGPGPISITNNSIHGFRPTVDGVQDASGSMGVGVILHKDPKIVSIERNHFYDNVIHLNVGPSANGSALRYNIFDTTAKAEAVYGPNTQVPKSLLIKGVNQLDITNNVFHNDKERDRILLRSSSSRNLLLMNNLFHKGRLYVSNTTSVTADHNAWSQLSQKLPGAFEGMRDLRIDDPQVDWSTWRPREGSPLVDAGKFIADQKDYFGNRISDTTPDIGVVEFNSDALYTGAPSTDQDNGDQAQDGEAGAVDDQSNPVANEESLESRESAPQTTSSAGECSDKGRIDILGYAKGEHVKGAIDVSVDANDDDGIRKVTLFANGEKLSEDREWPYEFRFNTYRHGGKNCVMFLKAVMVDSCGTTATDSVKLWVRQCQRYVEGK